MSKWTKICTIIVTLALVIATASGCSGQSGSATKFSETVSGENVCIWYECQNKIDSTGEESVIIEDLQEEPEDQPFGRETRVVWVKVYQGGKLTTYSCSDRVYLGYFAKMTDEEILEALKTEKEKFAVGQSEQPFSIYLYTDSAGQEVQFEGVPAIIDQGEKPMYFMTLISKDSVPAFQVYDSYYGGYELYNYDETMFGEACMITRCDKNAVFGLDKMDLEGANVDYETPEDLLHELNVDIVAKDKKSDKADEEAEDAGEGAEESGDAEEDAEA